MDASILQTVLFWLFSLLGIAGAVGLLLNRSPIYAALSLILNFFSLAGLYLSLGAEFLAAIQILVYAGAIMVLFLFVIMLLNIKAEQEEPIRFDLRRGFAFILGLAFIAEMLIVFRSFSKNVFATTGEVGTEGLEVMSETFAFGQVEPIGLEMMTNYLFPFEMISVILIVALMGAIVVARKHTYH